MTTKRAFTFALLLLIALTGIVAAATPSDEEPPFNPFLIDSPWQIGHRDSSRQASSPLPPPLTNSPTVQVRYFREDSGVDLSTSPFHVLSSKKYVDAPDGRVLWGVTLTNIYKYEINGDTFQFHDRIELHDDFRSIGWPFFGLAGDRIIVPAFGGLNLPHFEGTPCFGTIDALVTFRDGDTIGSPIECVGQFAFTPERIEAACGFQPTELARIGTPNGVLYTGEVATVMQLATGISYMLILDHDLTTIKTCEWIDGSRPTNQFPVEKLSETESAMYVASEGGIIKLVYAADANTLTRVWKRGDDFRGGRSGTTPTLMGFEGDQFVVVVDAPCAVRNPLSGNILCDAGDNAPARLVAIRRDDDRDDIYTVDLPDYIDTIENSPAVRGYDAVVANYTGYTPDGLKDGQPDFATGIAKLSWKPKQQLLSVDWHTDQVQVNSVPLILAQPYVALGTGAEEDGLTYQYAFLMRTGQLVARVPVGSATETSPGAADQVFDAGNNQLISDDRSIIWPGGNTLVRVKE